MKALHTLSLLIVVLFLHGCASSGYISPSSERSAFHQAALMGDVDKVRQLLPGVVNINALDSSGYSALHWAATTAAGQYVETVRVLLQAGANPDIPQSSAKMTPLFFASSAEVVNSLVDAGANIEFRAIDQSTALHHAKSLETLKALIARGADKDAKNISGHTAKEHFQMMLPHFEKNPSLSSIVKDYKDRIAFLEAGGTAHTTTQVAGFSSDPQIQAEPPKQRLDIDGLIAAQVCPMSVAQWIYTGEHCADGKAHGQGTAVHSESSWRFEGRIDAGLPVEGILFENDIETYEGSFKDGLAHGSGVCYYQGAPEECRYFKGQRIDALYKQRIEFDRQQTIAQRQSKSMQPATPRPAVQQATQQNTVGDAIGDELMEQGVKFLFDQLF